MRLSSSEEIRKYIQHNLTNVIKEELITGEKAKR